MPGRHLQKAFRGTEVKMIRVFINITGYENDIYPLVKAFYPEEEIKVIKASDGQLAETEEQPQKTSRIKHSIPVQEGSEADTFELHVDFAGDIITISLSVEGISVKESSEVSSSLPKPQYKNAMKRFLYQILSRAAGKELPWGILTGIRPTKLVYELLEQSVSEAGIHDRMKAEYYCSDARIAMSIQIAAREKELLEGMDYKNGFSLYIGIPFCPTTCLYCSFPSYSITKYKDLVEDYLTALEKEIRFGADCFPDKKLTAVYFGGGTPTTLTAGQLNRLLGIIKESFDFTHVKEFCVEAGRPDSITEEKLMVLKEQGVDRISINPQSMQQKTLDLIGRKHTVEEVYRAFHQARAAGHQNINMDIILGLPGEGPGELSDTLKQISSLNPDSLTVHTLALKRAARLNAQKEAYESMKASGVSEMLAETVSYAREKHYLPYYLYRQKNMADNLENIGYARYGREGLYNILIMEEKQTILALGAGAMSKFVFHGENRIERVDNVKSVTDYIGRIDEMIVRKRTFMENNPRR